MYYDDFYDYRGGYNEPYYDDYYGGYDEYDYGSGYGGGYPVRGGPRGRAGMDRVIIRLQQYAL